MKPQLLILMPFLTGAILAKADEDTARSTVHKSTEAHASAEAHSSGNGRKSSISKQSVTETSDGNQTIRKTVTVRNGKEETITEITDAAGNVTRFTGNGDKQPGQHQTPGQDRTRQDPSATDDGPWLGVRVQSASPALRDQLGLGDDEGVVVELLAPDSPAAKAGIQSHDILLSLGEVKLSSPESLRKELRNHQPGETIRIARMHKGERSSIDVTLEAKPADHTADGKQPADPQDHPQQPSGGIHVESHNGGASASASAGTGPNGLDAVLDDPNVPEQFKKDVRDMQKRMRDMQHRSGDLQQRAEDLKQRARELGTLDDGER